MIEALINPISFYSSTLAVLDSVYLYKGFTVSLGDLILIKLLCILGVLLSLTDFKSIGVLLTVKVWNSLRDSSVVDLSLDSTSLSLESS